MKKNKTRSFFVSLILTASLLPVSTYANVLLEETGNNSDSVDNIKKTIQLKKEILLERKQDILMRAEEKKASAQFRSNRIVVKYKNDKKPFYIINLPNNVAVLDAVKMYASNDNVEYAEPDYMAYADMLPNDPYYRPYQWHMDNANNSGINTEEAWDISTGEGVIVAIIDTGIAYENYYPYYRAPDLAGTCFVQGYDFINNDNHPNDDNNHGTHVAGTLAQSTNNSVGVAGVAYDACLMPIKALDKYGSGSYTVIADAIYYAVDNGAHVINMSLGGTYDSLTLKNAVAYAYNKGVTVVAAAGNSNTTTPHYPSSYNDYVISVGATDYNKDRAPYSNYGPDVDVVAPGGDTEEDSNGDGYDDGVLQQTFASSRQLNSFGYYFFQGTSMASPHVAGAAALLISNGNATTPDDIRTALESTAQDLGATGRDDIFGYGLIDAATALGWTSGPVNNVNDAPIANAGNDQTVSDTDGDGLETINLNGSGTDSDGTIVSYEWKEGTATVATSSAVTTLATTGTHTYTLTVIDNEGATASDDIMVTVLANQAPIANAGDDQTVIINATITFDGSGSTDPDGTIISYEWDFGDGNTATGETVNHTYTATSTYTTTLTVTDNGGLIGTDTATITVIEQPSELEVFYDSFEVSEWNGLWVEDAQNDWFRSSQRATNGARSAEVDGWAQDASLTSIVIDLQRRTTASITFDWLIESTLDTNEYLAVDISTNSGAWQEYTRLKGDVDTENVWHQETIEVANADNITLRFRGKMSSNNEDANVDNVRVVAK